MSAFTLNLADMEFILRQIKISEAHANGTALTAIYVDVDGNVVPQGTPGALQALPDPHVPSGLRTVDGSLNNLVPGREEWGAADNAMPRLLLPGNADNSDNEQFDTNGPAPGGVLTGGSYQNPGSIVDGDPRTISNLIVDMSFSNPAAIVAALTFAGSENIYGPTGDLQQVQDEFAALKAVLTSNADDATKQAARDAFDTFIETKGISASGGSLSIPNIAPDEGLSAPFNAWMTFFGQFFDHGLDLIAKGGNGTVFVPLAADDPLINGPDGIAGNADDLPPHLQFMTLTRATPLGGSQINTTTPFVDQNQTYTSHASHQVFLREYELRDVDGEMLPFATGNLLDGSAPNSLPTWADVKTQARDILGINLTDLDVSNVPLLRTDPYGEFIRGTNGFPLLITGVGIDGIPNTVDDSVIEGNPAAPISTLGAVRTAHAFLDDIAHNAVPVVAAGVLVPDADGVAGNPVASNPQTGRNTEYDDELLDRHFITGDGRGNENIGLTTVHHIFHSEHNRQVEAQKFTVLMSRDLDFINQWLADPITQAELDAIPTTIPTTQAGRDAILDDLVWDGERIFQAARFATEMQYQHLVFEEFARKIQPAIDPFVFNNITDVDPAIFSEFANTVYRFGHSMLTDSMPRIILNEDGSVQSTDDMGLITSFLNPIAFSNDGTITHDQAAGAVVRGMTIERGNEIDEFIVNALRNNLLGLPLDLAAINIARGRDTNMPSLNEAREQLFGASGSTFLTPYDSWVDFAANIKNPASVINFIAAYGKHQTVLDATTLEGKRAAATALVLGGTGAPGDRVAFLNGTGPWTPEASGLNDIDLWIGGLAEKKMPFGGMLGSTFNAIFELQMENLQDGDRFYYLSRTQGQNLLVSLEQNSFAKLIMANTDMAQPGADGIRGTADDVITRHIGVDSFANYDFVLEVNADNQADQNGAEAGVDPTGNDAILEAIGRGKVQRDDPTTGAIETNFLRFTGGEHIVVGGTNGNDTIITDFGDDGIWGDDGDDRIESGAGVDLVNGGGGNDIITDSGDSFDFLKGDEGDDVIANSNGIDILMGGSGQDVIFVGVDDTEVFAGQGNDFVAGGDGVDILMGNEGDDWIEGGGGFDSIAGDNSELFFDSKIIGHDVMFSGNEEQDFDAESGDDIMIQGESVIRNEGMFGFDWASYKDVSIAADADLRTPIFTTEQEDILRNRFDKVEALSGWDKNDILRGDDRVFDVIPPGTTVGTAENIFFNDALDQAGLDRIAGLSDIVDLGPTGLFERGNVLLGGKGSDLLQGNGGDDVIDGDRFLNVRIRITAAGQENLADNQIATVDSLRHVFTAEDAGAPSWVGKSLFELMLSRTVVPNQLHIVREILNDTDNNTSIDVAQFNDVLANYTIIDNGDGSFTVTQNAVTVGVIDPLTERALVSDGTDIVRNVEILRFADQDVSLTRPELKLNALNTLDFRDNFNAAGFNNTNGTTPWASSWIETNDGTTQSTAAGQIQLDAGDSNQLRFVGSNTGVVSNGAEITRDINLGSAQSVVISFTADPIGLEPAENVQAFFAADGVTFLPLVTITGGGAAETHTFELEGPFSPAAKIRFTGTSMNGGEGVNIDNLIITPFVPDPAPTINFETTFTEDGAQVAIADGPGIVEDSGLLESARIVLTNAQAGDALIVVGTLPDSIASTLDTSVTGEITLVLTGTATILEYQAAIRAVRFSNTSQSPSTVDRTIDVTVNDGFLNSNVATTTVNVISVNDTPVGTADTIITNITTGAIVVPTWALLANDVDPDGPALNLTAVNNPNGLGSLALGGASVSFTDTGGAGGTFNYAISDTIAADANTTATVTRDVAGNIDGGTGNDILVGGDTANTFDGGLGNDIIFAGGGNDNIVWNANGNAGPTDGRDFVNGGTGTDTFTVNGNGTVETFILYTRAAAVSDGIAINRPDTEILITRNGVVIAELVDIQELIINTGAGADTIIPRGDFSQTTLSLNTITINGTAADDTVDISALNSAHRIVFRSNGGNDTIVGTLRPQDVIEVPAGNNPADYVLESDNGETKTLSNGSHSITFVGEGVPQLKSAGSDDDEEDDDDCDNDGSNSGSNDDDDQSDDESEDDESEDDESEDDEDDDDGQQPAPNPSTGGSALPFVVYLGVAGGGTGVGGALGDILSGLDGADALFGMGGDDSLVGHGGNDNLVAGDGNDLVFGDDGNDTVLAGAGDDTVFGGNGNDTIWADGGNDRITGGEGSDVIDAGDGNDTIYASLNDGNDVISGGAGADTIDYQAITAALTINLGANGSGSASSAQSGTDALNGIENVKGGAGNDTITASNAHNILDGGAGDDTFVFNSAAAADGDRIDGFTLGDTIDLTSFMPVPVGGTFVGNSATFNLAGQVKLVFVGEDTRVDGNTDTDGDVDFSILVSGRHLTGSDFA